MAVSFHVDFYTIYALALNKINIFFISIKNKTLLLLLKIILL